MKGKISTVVNKTKKFISKHNTEICIGIGVGGMITTTVLAVKATPKAMLLVEEAKKEKGEELTKFEVIKAGWRPYVPTVCTGTISTLLILYANSMHVKQKAAIATAYSLSERTLLTYKDKVIETIGEKKEKEIRDKIAQDEIDKDPVSKANVIITTKGNTLCRDMFGRYFRSDLDLMRKAINEVNRELNLHDYAALNEFYSRLNLDTTEAGANMGWHIDDGLIELEYSPCMSEDEEPCIAIHFSIPPKYEYNRYM